MTTLRDALISLLENDATLAAAATGGIWDYDKIVTDLGTNDGLTASVITPANSAVVSPSIYIKWVSDSPYGPIRAKAKRIFFDVFFYDHASYETIKTMKARCYELLHDGRVSASGGYVMQIISIGGALQSYDDTLGALMERASYEVRFSSE